MGKAATPMQQHHERQHLRTLSRHIRPPDDVWHRLFIPIVLWILGSFCVRCYSWRYDPGNVPHVRIDLGLLCSLLLLALELIADGYRYYHVLYVLNNNAKGKSGPTSDSQQ